MEDMVTILFQKEACGKRDAGDFTTIYSGVAYEPSHICVAVPRSVYVGVRYDERSSGFTDPETGLEVMERVERKTTVAVDIERLREMYPEGVATDEEGNEYSTPSAIDTGVIECNDVTLLISKLKKGK
jgi:hypothetical protein